MIFVDRTLRGNHLFESLRGAWFKPISIPLGVGIYIYIYIWGFLGGGGQILRLNFENGVGKGGDE